MDNSRLPPKHPSATFTDTQIQALADVYQFLLHLRKRKLNGEENQERPHTASQPDDELPRAGVETARSEVEG